MILALIAAFAGESTWTGEGVTFSYPDGWSARPVEALTPGGRAVFVSDGGSGWLHIERTTGSIAPQTVFDAALAGREDVRRAKQSKRDPRCRVAGAEVPCLHATFLVRPRVSDTPGIPPKPLPIDQRLFPKGEIFVLSAFTGESWPVREPGLARVLVTLAPE